MIDPDLARAVESHTAEWFEIQGSVPGVELHRDADAIWMVQPGSAWGNAAVDLRFKKESAGARLDQIIRRYRTNGRGAGFWVSPFATPDDLGERLRQHGFRCRKHFPGMHCDVTAVKNNEPTMAGLEFAVIKDHSVFKTHPHPYYGRISTPIRRFQIARGVHLTNLRPQCVWELMAALDGRPVGSCLLFLGKRVAGLHDVGVIESERRRGIGRALVAYACRFARDRGYRGAVLIAAGMGESVYRRVGFREVCRMSYWYSSLVKRSVR